MRKATQEPIGHEWPDGSIEVAVVVGLLTSRPHVTEKSIDRVDFERIVDEALLPLLAPLSERLPWPAVMTGAEFG